MHYYAGVDIGTTHTKLVLADHSLNILWQTKKGYQSGFGAELDPAELLLNTRELITALLQVVPANATKLIIGFSTAMHSLMLADKNGKALTPLLTWADNSSLPIVDEWKGNPGIEALFSETGTAVHPMSPFCKLGWMKKNSPELLSHAHKAVGIKEYIWFHFTGYWEIDDSLASATGLFSRSLRSWYPPALQYAGVSVAQLADPVSVTHCREPVDQWLSQPADSGISIKLTIGASDGCLAQLGSNILQPGAAALTIGTSGAIRISSGDPISDPGKELFTYILDELHYVIGGAINNGGIALQWWAAAVMNESADPVAVMEGFSAALVEAPAGADGLVCLPWFSGERAPVWDAHASGIFAGVKNTHTQAHFRRAILEGICFSFRVLLEKLEAMAGPVQYVVASGGFVASAGWLQLMADILQKPLMVPQVAVDASALGAIGMAMKADGNIKSWAEFSKLNQAVNLRYNPKAIFKTIYDNQYSRYKRLCHS